MMNQRIHDEFLKILAEELIPAMGCTEPIALAYAGARAREVLGCLPDRVIAHCSGNMIKNVRCVTIPNSEHMVGIEAGVMLGIVGGNASKCMEVLEDLTDEDRKTDIEGSRLTYDQTRYIFETNTIGIENEVLNVDDVIETANHFRCIELIIDNAKSTLTEKFIKELHLTLKNGTSDSRKDWFTVGDYKKFPNEVGGMETASPEEVSEKMKSFLMEYNGKKRKTFEDILEFHVKFERIHPFQDGNGRVGRLIMFKECLKYNIVPFIIEDDLKMFYYRGLKEWNIEKGYLTDTCLTAQDRYKAYLKYFRIDFAE